MLLPPVVPLYLCLPDSLFLDKLCFVGQAGQHHLVTSQVDIRVRKNIENFGKDLLDQLVSFVEGHIERAHEASSESASDAFVFGCKSPAGSVSGSVEFRDNSYSSFNGIINQVSCLLGCVDLFVRVGGVFGDLRVGVQQKGEGILVNHVPVHYIELVVHECVDGLLEQVHGQVVARRVYHH